MLSHNMFAYCQSNPVNYVDTQGTFFGALIGAAIGGLGGLIGGGISAAIKGENVLAGMASGGLGGLCGGAVAGTVVEVFVSPGTSVGSAVLVGALAGAAGGATSSMVSQTSNYYFNNGTMEGFEFDWESFAISIVTGTIFNAAGTGFGQSQALFYSYEPMVSAIAGGYFAVGNAIADSAIATLDALIDQTREAILGHRPNTYHFGLNDLGRLMQLRQSYS